MIQLQSWLKEILADPVTKQPADLESRAGIHGVIDARVFLKNTHGYHAWLDGQAEFERWSLNDKATVETYRFEIEYDRPIYEHFRMRGRILDCGGAAGTVREFLPSNVEFVSTDPWLQAPFASSPARKQAYSCLNHPLNFVGATGEFQPFVSGSFDWVHLRSVLDHVQVPDLVLLEAKRVLRPHGRVLIGLYVEGGRNGVVPVQRRAKASIKKALQAAGIERWKDHHVWHPSYQDLLKLIADSGFTAEETYWQPYWKDTVCYVCARK